MTDVKKRLGTRRLRVPVAPTVAVAAPSRQRARPVSAPVARPAPRTGPGRIARLPQVDGKPFSVLREINYTRPPRVYRKGELLHVSDLVNRCSRQIAIIEQLDITPPMESGHVSRQLIFALGDACHDFVRDALAANIPDRVYGVWKCRCGHTEHQGTLTDALQFAACTRCGTPLTQYHELRVPCESLQLVGNIDLVLYDGTAFLPVEIKSISTKEFEKVGEGFKPDHVVQGGLYWYMLREAGYPLYDHVLVLYVVKEFSFKGSPVHERLVPWARIEPLVNTFIERRHVQMRQGVLPPRKTCCTSPVEGDAKYCPSNVLCFLLPEGK